MLGLALVEQLDILGGLVIAAIVAVAVALVVRRGLIVRIRHDEEDER